MRITISLIVASIFVVFSLLAQATEDMIVVRSSMKSPDEVVDAIKVYSAEKHWAYMGATKVKPVEGEVTFVKVCIPEVGALIWPLGLHLSALLPCGNFGVYKSKDKTEISMLHPRYMQMLYPHPDVEKASTLVTPLFNEMLESVIKSAAPISNAEMIKASMEQPLCTLGSELPKTSK